MRTCKVCNETKPMTEFYAQKRTCKPCLVDIQRATRNNEDQIVRENAALLARWRRV